MWTRWPELDREDQVRVARLLRFRPFEVANRKVFANLVEALVPRRIAGIRVLDRNRLLVDLGCPPLEYVDECVASQLAERALRERHAASVADAGEYGMPLYIPSSDRSATRTVDVRYRLAREERVDPEEPIDIGAPAEADRTDVPIAELKDIAARLDTVFGQEHRTRCVDTIFAHLQASEGNDVGEVWTLEAGPTGVFHAPTGVGKNVLAELLACWCAARGQVASLVVPTNATVVKTACAIARSLRALGVAGDVVPLTSPHSAQKVAETTVRGGFRSRPAAMPAVGAQSAGGLRLKRPAGAVASLVWSNGAVVVALALNETLGGSSSTTVPGKVRSTAPMKALR